jgi:hypothetical protein
MDPDPIRHPSGTMPEELVPLAEGARRLGLAYDTARKHLAAGTLRGEKQQGRWWVWAPRLPEPSGTPSGTDPAASGTIPDALIEAQRSEIAYLRSALDSEIEARRRADHLVAGLMERIPELSAGDTAGDASAAQNTAPQRGDVAAEASEATARQERPWWRRLLGR